MNQVSLGNKSSKIRANPKLALVGLVAIALAFAGLTSAHAQVLVTSGDSTGGYSPLSSSGVGDFGYDWSGNAVTVQGVSFTGSLPTGDSLTLPSYYYTLTATNGITGADTNDVNLNSATNESAILGDGNGSNGSTAAQTITLTLGNLASGTTYKLDSLLSAGQGLGPQDMTVVVSGGGASGTTSQVMAYGELWDVSSTFTSNGNPVTVTYNTDYGDSFFTAASLTSATPEPSTYLLLGVAGLMFLAIRRIKSQVS